MMPLTITPIATSASPEEAAALTAALEHFMRQTAASAQTAEPEIDRWTRMAILQGTEREDLSSSIWGDPSLLS